jgi:inorganic pyrophosphatase
VDLSKISAGQHPPHDIHVVIEIPQGSLVKYELDKESGAQFVDRFLQTSMVYPSNYGFIPCTLSADGDPCDAMVISQSPVIAGAVIRARPIGVLLMEDESGVDEKILAVPVEKLDPFYYNIQSYSDLPEIFNQQISHFFQHYKDLEKGKWVKIRNWAGPEEARKVITQGMERYNQSKAAA